VIIREGNIKMITIQSAEPSSIEHNIHEHMTIN
jgi:hypothetical protein